MHFSRQLHISETKSINYKSHQHQKSDVSEEIQRSFFNVRYTFPGYTFLLLIVIAIASWLFDLTQKFGGPHAQNIPPELLAAGIGALFLLNGAPVGFLVSQSWFIFYKWYVIRHSYLKPFIAKGGGLEKNDFAESIVLVDLAVLRMASERQFVYLQRRYDLLNLLGCEIFAIISGLFVATALRIILLQDLSFPLSFSAYVPLAIWLDWTLGGFVVLLLILGLKALTKEHATAVRRILGDLYSTDSLKMLGKPAVVV